MHTILKRELKVAVLPPTNKKSLKPKTKSLSNFKTHPVFTDGSNLLDANIEYFWIMGLRVDQRLAFVDLVAIGDAVSAKVGLKESARGPLFYKVPQIVIVHNHPSGNLAFNEDDIRLTKKFIRDCTLLDIELKDHLIITEGDGINSLQKENKLDELYQIAILEELEVREAAKIITQQSKVIFNSAIKLLRLGVNINEVAQITGLTIKQLQKIQG